MTTTKFYPSEVKVIVTLQRHGAQLLRKTLAEKTGISDKNISKYIKPLLEKKMITIIKRKKGKTYEHLITLTPKGMRMKFETIPEIKAREAKEPKAKPTKPKKIALKELEIIHKEINKRMKQRGIPTSKHTEREKIRSEILKEKTKPPKAIIPRELPESSELKKELRLLIELVLTHRREQYTKYGYKNVSEIRVQINTLIDQL